MPDKIQQPEQSLETPQTAKYSPSQIATFLGGIIFLLVLAGASFTAFKSSNNQNAKNTQEDTTKPLNIAPYSLVYGVWTTDNSVIRSFDLESGKTYDLASLPTNVKKITVLDNNRLLYIANTDAQDHGKEIDIYDIKNKKSTTVIKAAEGFGIDDYVVSPNKRYVADWEVTTDPDTGAFFGGKSRVYTIDLKNPSQKHLIYDEKADHPIHYPRGILNNGTVYMDTFLPNSGAGWAYGMSVSDFTGTNKKDLANMTNGTYGTQPELSPDGKYFVFAGYDGKYGAGTTDTNGYRLALVKPNTINLLNTQNDQIITLPGIPNSNTYSAVQWDNNNIMYTQLSSDPHNLGTYIYDLMTHKIQKLNNDSKNIILSTLTGSKYIEGQSNNSSQVLGNLGPGYNLAVSNLQTVDSSTSQTYPLPIIDPLIQFIGTETSDFFTNTAQLIQKTTSSDNDQLQLHTFAIKSSLRPVRINQQSDPVNPKPMDTPVKGGSHCRPPGVTGGDEPPCSTSTPPPGDPTKCTDMLKQQCMPPGYTGDLPNVFNAPQSYQDCVFSAQKANPGVCPGSPLYLYGQSGMHVNVKIFTPIYGSNPAYHKGYSIILKDNSLMSVNGNLYNKISYNYTPAIQHITPPKYGAIVSRRELSSILNDYAVRLGLNEKETNNLIRDSNSLISSPYIFVSFFDQDTSKAILPISFSPRPDVYRNIVFYFKQLNQKPNYSIQPPTFEKIQRHGFTAVEISEMVE